MNLDHQIIGSTPIGAFYAGVRQGELINRSSQCGYNIGSNPIAG